MSFLFAEKVIEYVIRVGVNDIFQDPTILDRIFVTNKCVGGDSGTRCALVKQSSSGSGSRSKSCPGKHPP